MNHRNALRRALAAVAALLLCASAQAAGLFRAYVSSTGNDANPCTLASPCRLLPAALTAVADSGEIWMLDSANYNVAQVEVTKSVTILAVPGALGSVVSIGGGNGLNINTAGVKLTLRNLVIVQSTSGYWGVYFAQGAELNIEGCEIANHPGLGGAVFANAAGSKLTIKDSVLRNSATGLYLANSTKATLDRVRIENNANGGVEAGSGPRMTISNSVFSGNGVGIDVSASSAGESTYATIAQSVISHSIIGLRLTQGASATTQAIVDGNTITDNGQAINFGSGGGTPTAYSRGNNTLKFNTLDFSGAGAAFTAFAGQ
jgi:hypothetical protein